MSVDNLFFDDLSGEIRLMDFQMLEEARFREIYDLIQKCSDSNKRLSLSLGGRIDPEYFEKESEIASFLKANDLGQKFLMLRKQLSFDREKGPALPVVLEGNSITELYWDDLEKYVFEHSIRFFHKNHIAFQTDLDLKLESPFSVMGEGIVQYDPWRASAIFPIEKKSPGESAFEIWRGESEFFVLTSAKGSVYAIGMKDDHIVTPPEEYFHRWNGYEKTREAIPEEKLKQILQKVSSDKYSWKIKRSGYLCELLKMK